MELTRLIGLVCYAALTAASGVHAQVTYRTVALSHTDGPLGPGLGPGVIFDNDFPGFDSRTFDTPVLDHLGNVAFRARFSGDGVTSANNSAHFIVNTINCTAYFRKGNPVPGLDGVLYGENTGLNSNLDVPPVLQNGRIVTMSYLTGDKVEPANSAAILLGDQLGEYLLIRAGDASPTGIPGTTFYTPQASSNIRGHPLRVSDSGVVQAVIGSASPGSDTLDGIWQFERTEPPILIAREDMPAPGIVGEYIARVSTQHALSRAGHSAFSVTLQDRNENLIASALYANNEAGDVLVIHSDDPLPGVPDATFSSGSALGINSSGQALVFSEATVNGVGGTGNSGYWRWDGETLLPIVQEGMPHPLLDGPTPVIGYAKINASGHVAYVLAVGGGYVYRFDGSTHELVAYPGMFPYDPVHPVRSLGVPCMNGRGQIAFGASDASLVSPYEEGYDSIFATDLEGKVVTVVRSGDEIEVTPGDFRTVSAVYFAHDSGGEDGQRMSFNDRGELVFKALFTDYTGGMIVATIDPIICPGDVTNDFEIDVDDLNVVLSSWSMSVTPGTAGDVDGTGFVDVDDLNLVLGAWGTVCN